MLAGVISNMSVADVEVLVALVIAGFVGWRWKRGDFYKAVATEKTEEADKLRQENQLLHRATDITPILHTQQVISERLDEVAHALERHTTALDGTLAKVADMNGSLRAHSVAMEALADRLISDEAVRALLLEASKQPSERRRTA